jgi:hypothetical protein
MLTQIGNYIHKDSKISTKLSALGLGFGILSVAVTYLYPTSFWLSGFLNVFAFSAFGVMGITQAFRQEIPGFIFIRGISGSSARHLGVVQAIICFIFAIGMLFITLLAISALNPPR